MKHISIFTCFHINPRNLSISCVNGLISGGSGNGVKFSQSFFRKVSSRPSQSEVFSYFTNSHGFTPCLPV